MLKDTACPLPLPRPRAAISFDKRENVGWDENCYAPVTRKVGKSMRYVSDRYLMMKQICKLITTLTVELKTDLFNFAEFKFNYLIHRMIYKPGK